MSKTAAGLIAYAKSKIGTPYVYGAKGAVMSLAKIQALRKMYGSNCVWKSDDKKAGRVCVDCSGANLVLLIFIAIPHFRDTFPTTSAYQIDNKCGNK